MSNNRWLNKHEMPSEERKKELHLGDVLCPVGFFSFRLTFGMGDKKKNEDQKLSRNTNQTLLNPLETVQRCRMSHEAWRQSQLERFSVSCFIVLPFIDDIHAVFVNPFLHTCVCTVDPIQHDSSMGIYRLNQNLVNHFLCCCCFLLTVAPYNCTGTAGTHTMAKEC